LGSFSSSPLSHLAQVRLGCLHGTNFSPNESHPLNAVLPCRSSLFELDHPNIHGSDQDDLFLLNLSRHQWSSPSTIQRLYHFDGGSQSTAVGDALRLIGHGDELVKYKPHPTIFGSGTLLIQIPNSIDLPVYFSALEPVSCSEIPWGTLMLHVRTRFM
jgi:hypothetical protein